jgi:Mlc titration factor MtfA (ptsG expression regulator)
MRPIPALVLSSITGILALTPFVAAGEDSPSPRPQLQIINGSDQAIEIFWLKSATERIPNGAVKPGRDHIITTTLGHRFDVIGRDDKSSMTVTSEVPVQGVRFDPQGRDGVPAFYTQRVSANGFPIVASAKVNPYALKEAAYLVDMMLAKRPDVRAAMIKSGARMCLMAYNEYTTELPEFVRMAEEKEKEKEFPDLPAKDYWDARARGLGGSDTDPLCTVAEENVLGYPGDPYQAECILIHEFAHNLHLRGLLNVDPTFDTRLKATYDSAMKAGLWKGKYAAMNHYEYFAEGVQSWFDDNRVNDHDHNHVHLRSQLIEYDPGLAALCREVFGDTDLKYTKPATRLTGHLAGYDPTKAPTFAWPDRLRKAKAEIRAQAVGRDKAANADSKRETRSIASWTVHISRELLAKDGAATAKALELLQAQLEEIIRVVPQAAVAELQQVPLYFSPEYSGIRAAAEYHPGAGWLSDHGRDPIMAKGIEFTNIRIFEAETRRMPNFALHELAHAYHDRYLPESHNNPAIKAAYEVAKASGKYDRVERQDSEGRKRLDRAYAITNPAEYFAETTEAYFSRNDFFPFTKEELKQHDPAMFELLGKLWGSPTPP